MAVISFDDAKTMVVAGRDWLKNVSELIQGNNPTPLPTDIFGTQKLAFKISKSQVAELSTADQLVGILGYEAEKESLCIILVGLSSNNTPSATLLPCQTWPQMLKMEEIDAVLNGLLKP